jgi:hypothetical protein
MDSAKQMETTLIHKTRNHHLQSEPGCEQRNRAPLRPWLPMLGATALLWAGYGCGKDEADKFVPVAGKVTLDGKPLSVGSVSFRPDASKGNKSCHGDDPWWRSGSVAGLRGWFK